MPRRCWGCRRCRCPAASPSRQVAAIVGRHPRPAQRHHHMRANLDAYEQQLVVMEQLMEPLEAMTRSWAQTERRITG